LPSGKSSATVLGLALLRRAGVVARMEGNHRGAQARLPVGRDLWGHRKAAVWRRLVSSSAGHCKLSGVKAEAVSNRELLVWASIWTLGGLALVVLFRRSESAELRTTELERWSARRFPS